jgi:hypothetical protein
MRPPGGKGLDPHKHAATVAHIAMRVREGDTDFTRPGGSDVVSD